MIDSSASAVDPYMFIGEQRVSGQTEISEYVTKYIRFRDRS